MNMCVCEYEGIILYLPTIQTSCMFPMIYCKLGTIVATFVVVNILSAIFLSVVGRSITVIINFQRVVAILAHIVFKLSENVYQLLFYQWL